MNPTTRIILNPAVEPPKIPFAPMYGRVNGILGCHPLGKLGGKPFVLMYISMNGFPPSPTAGFWIISSGSQLSLYSCNAGLGIAGTTGQKLHCTTMASSDAYSASAHGRSLIRFTPRQT
jgi:hypothetical protein